MLSTIEARTAIDEKEVNYIVSCIKRRRYNSAIRNLTYRTTHLSDTMVQLLHQKLKEHCTSLIIYNQGSYTIINMFW